MTQIPNTKSLLLTKTVNNKLRSLSVVVQEQRMEEVRPTSSKQPSFESGYWLPAGTKCIGAIKLERPEVIKSRAFEGEGIYLIEVSPPLTLFKDSKRLLNYFCYPSRFSTCVLLKPEIQHNKSNTCIFNEAYSTLWNLTQCQCALYSRPKWQF